MMNPMVVAELIIRVSCVLNRGSGTEEDTLYFHNKPHEQLVFELERYLEANSEHLGKPQLEKTHGLNEHGTDLILHSPCGKLGFQVKSEFDVGQVDFAAKVKQQLAESSAHGLAKWYLLVCCPVRVPSPGNTELSVSHEAKIQHLHNEFSMYKTPYVAFYGPRNSIRFFNKSSPLGAEEFAWQFHHWAYSPDAFRNLSSEMLRKGTGEEIVDVSRLACATPPTSLNKMAELLKWNLEPYQLELTREDLLSVLERLKKLPPRSRQLLSIIVERAREVSPPRQGLGTVSFVEIENSVALDGERLLQELKVLDAHSFIRLHEDEPDQIYIGSWHKNWPVWNALQEFSHASGVDLGTVIGELKFNLLD